MSTEIQVHSVSQFLSSATTKATCPECGGEGYVLRARNSEPYFYCHKCKKVIRDIQILGGTQ